MHTPDLTVQNIERVAELFPSCIVETRDEKGGLRRSIDFDQLRQELSSHIVEGPRERYHLDWPGKKEALLAANAPIAKTLRPCRKESVDFETTKNLFIEGDNLDALKLLQETYLGKVKLIYIDPPYNTGNDFIYDDDFSTNTEDYLLRSNQKDSTGQRLIANTESNGRFHSDWNSMVYSRIRLARNFLNEEGVILISIDDRELGNLMTICNEVFGEDNFLAVFVWEKRTSRENRKVFSTSHDYIVGFAKDRGSFQLKRGCLPYTEEVLARFKNPDNDPRGDWQSVALSVQGGHGTKSQFYDILTPSGKRVSPPSGLCWRYTEAKLKELVADNRIWFGQDGGNVPRLKLFLSEVEQGLTPHTLWLAEEVGTTDSGKREVNALFEGASVFETPKPVGLLKRFIQIVSVDKDYIAMDFFAGSATSAHAVMQLNAEDGGTRRFILVQLPEASEEGSEAQKAGYSNIAEICKERIRRAGAKIKQENATTASNLDVGFRVLKIHSSNMQDVFYAPDEVKQGDLMALADNIKPDRTPEDLLFQVLVDWGVDLALPITSETIQGKKVFFVDGNALAACFDANISEDLVKELAKRKPLRAVFRDSSFENDSVKINVEQIFKLLSPETEVKSI